MPVSAWTLLMALFAVSKSAYVNWFGEPANMVCPRDQILFNLISVHSERYEDRRWKFHCRATKTKLDNCAWSGYINSFGDLLAYSCPDDKVVAGMKSFYNNEARDRRFAFRCCTVQGKRTVNCSFSEFVNEPERRMVVHVSPTSRIPGAIKGAASCQDEETGDRRWKFLICRLG